MSLAGEGGDESASAADARLRELTDKYDILGNEVVTVSDKVSSMEGQLGEILGMLKSARLGESGSAADAASRREDPPAREPGGLREGGGIAPAPQQHGGGTRPGASPEVYPTMPAGPALETGPSGDIGEYHSQGMTPVVTSGEHSFTSERRPRGFNVTIPKLDEKVECFAWKQRFIAAAKTLRLDGQFIGDTERLAPVGEASLSTADFLQQGFRAEEIDRGLYAMNMLTAALVKPADLAIQSRSLTARQALDEICRMHEPETEGTKVELLQRLLRFKVPSSTSPTSALLKLEGLADRLRERGIPLDPAFILVLFVMALPLEYEHTKNTLMGQASMERQDVLRRVNTQYGALVPESKKMPASEQAYFAGTTGGEDAGKKQGARKKGKGGNGEGGGRGNSSNGGGNGGNGESNGGGKFLGNCFRCGRPGHRMVNCKTPEAELGVTCDVCGGRGHKGEQCPTPRTGAPRTETGNIAVVEHAHITDVINPGEDSSDVDSVEDCAF